MKAVPLPDRLRSKVYCYRGEYCAVGWLGHCMGRKVVEGDCVDDAFEEAIAKHYTVPQSDVARLRYLNDSLRPKDRVPKFKEWCQKHGIPVQEGAGHGPG